MENTNTQLTINDIALARDVIDAAVKRGAFGAAEAKQVGTLYEKIDVTVYAGLGPFPDSARNMQWSEWRTVPMESERDPGAP